jgi:A/G-specific adenine glycosylase
MADQLKKLPDALLPWFDANKRDLPWRQDRDPYHIWLSEIMLQQTRVEAVKGYYARFVAELPAIADLANCDDERLHKLWEGLGYYSRVRNLKKAAQVIMDTHGGIFPGEYDKILALPGIGDYTAGAIASIAFDQKRAAVDGNVLRVYARLMNDPTPIDTPEMKAKVRRELEEIYPNRAGDFTQALMELGATLCGPNWAPKCEECPCCAFCKARAAGTAQTLPVKSPRRQKRQEDRTVFILECDGCYALTKRPNKGLLASLWQFPDAPAALELPAAIELAESWGLQIKDVRRQLEKKHIFTHIIWNMRGFYMEVKTKCDQFQWFSAEEIEENAALPTAYRQFWEALKND